ncbi:3-deoxy-7-phosphoheptulonate synthase [Streptomyces sp. NBC_01201]|nr:3-deoxy-7-phosphoheptulonate synthase [Streptomyces sp. NBC_01201]
MPGRAADAIRRFVEGRRALGTHPGGVHMDRPATASPSAWVAAMPFRRKAPHHRYETACGSRLNHARSPDLAFPLAGMYRDGIPLRPAA